MKDLNKLSKEIYEANKAKGFHEKKHSIEHMLCLVISELMEAVEADRKGWKADVEYVNKLTQQTSKPLFDVLFKNEIKDTVEDELADAVIRLLDTAGALGVKLNNNSSFQEVIKKAFEIQSFTESIYSIIRVLMTSPFDLSNKISNTISHLELLCEVLDIDLWQHVELKLKYNSLRPYKHGKQY